MSDLHVAMQAESSRSSFLRPECARAHTGIAANHPTHPRTAANAMGIQAPDPLPDAAGAGATPQRVANTSPLHAHARTANTSMAPIRAQTGGKSSFLSSEDLCLCNSIERIS